MAAPQHCTGAPCLLMGALCCTWAWEGHIFWCSGPQHPGRQLGSVLFSRLPNSSSGMLFWITWPAEGLRHRLLQLCGAFFAAKMLLQPASPLLLEPWLVCPNGLLGSFCPPIWLDLVLVAAKIFHSTKYPFWFV